MRRQLVLIAAWSIGSSATAQNSARPRDVYAPSACAEVTLPRSADSIDKLVIARMRTDRIPGAQLSILRRGHVETRVYGYSDLDRCVRADSNTIFGIGSVSKQLTAYATLRLVQAGTIALDEPITKYLPEARPAWDGITLRHLLTHTSGIRDYAGDDPFHPLTRIERRVDYSADSLIRVFSRDPLNFPVGTEFAYSNTGYFVLAIALERAAHMPFADVMRTLVYEPLGMRSSRQWNPRIILPDMAVGYVTSNDTLIHGAYRAPTAGRWGGDAGVIATAADLARFQAELMHPRFVSPNLLREMIGRSAVKGGGTVTYGFGIQPDDISGVPMWAHSGSFSAGYTAFAAAFPTRDLAVTIVTNSNSAEPWLIAMSALPLLDDSLHAVPRPPASDPDAARTAHLRSLLSGDSTALAMTPNFRSLVYGQVKGHFQNMPPGLPFAFLGCDDLHRSKAALPELATSECYYRLGNDRMGVTLAVYFTDAGAVADVRPKG
jgi:CubicO group peptidase (beta-lactamase class C family)